MSLPNANIASAFIESYICIRKENWKLTINDSDSIKIPSDAIVKHKLDICLKMLELFKNAKTFEHWINILDEIYLRERAEFNTQQNRYAIIRAITSQPLAGDMLHAIRTYILSELKYEPEFKRLKDDLLYRKKELEKQILWDKEHGTDKVEIEANHRLLDKIDKTLEARNEADDYFLKFFDKAIKVYDIQAKALDEKTIDHFKANVINGKRQQMLSLKLLDDNPHIPNGLIDSQVPSTVVKNETVNPYADKKDDVPTTIAEVTENESSSLQTHSIFSNPTARRRSARITKDVNYESDKKNELSDYDYTSKNNKRRRI